jgi:hypothetical protein
LAFPGARVAGDRRVLAAREARRPKKIDLLGRYVGGLAHNEGAALRPTLKVDRLLAVEVSIRAVRAIKRLGPVVESRHNGVHAKWAGKRLLHGVLAVIVDKPIGLRGALEPVDHINFLDLAILDRADHGLGRHG